MTMNLDGEDWNITPAVWKVFDDWYGDKSYRCAGMVADLEAAVRETVADEQTAPINPAAVDTALRHFLAHEDYDLHKAMECGEDDGLDHYPEAVDEFVQVYEGAL